MSTQQRIQVVLDGRPDPVEVVADNRDYVGWDIIAPQRRWPKMADAPILAGTYLAWHALKRTGEYSGDFDAFRMNDCVSVELLGSEPVDPTLPAPTAG